MTTRVAALVVSALVTIPSLAQAAGVDDFTRMWNNTDADTEHGRGRDVVVLNVSSRFHYEPGSAEVGPRPTGRFRALAIFRDASRQAVVAVREGTAPVLGVWDLRKLRVPGYKKPAPPVLVAAKPRNGGPTFGSPTKPTRMKTPGQSKLARFTDPGRELMRRLQAQSRNRLGNRNQGQRGFKTNTGPRRQ